jgi:hypothetical protein
LYHAKTPWLAAWNRFRETVTPLDYVLASGSPGDNMLLTGWQVHRPDRESWRNILTRFDTVQVLTAEARLNRSWPGGPVSGLFIARAGPDAGELGRFTLSAQSPEGLDAMLDTAVRQIDMIYAAALRSGRLQSEPDLSQELAPLLSSGPLIGAPPSDIAAEPGAVMASIELFVPTPDAATAASIEAQLRATPGITSVTTTSLSLGGTSQMLVSFNVSRASLDYALDGKALRITLANGQNVLRPRLPSEAPLPPPAPPVPISDAPPEIPAGTPPTANPAP